MQLTRTRRFASILEGEPLASQLSPQPVTHRLGDRLLMLLLPRRQQAAELDLEHGWLLSIHGISASEPLAGQWVQSGSEQQLHLLSGDLAPRGETDPGRAAAVPVTRRLALGAVVVGQGAVAPAGRIHSSDLAGQVLI